MSGLPEVIIRPATMQDLDDIRRLLDQTDDYHHELLPTVYLDAENSRVRTNEEFAATLVDEDAIILLAEVRATGDVVGLAEGKIRRTSPAPFMRVPYAKLDELVVDVDHQRQGIARRLISHFLAWLKERHMRDCRLIVVAENGGAIQLYKELGFETIHLEMQVSL